MAAKLRPLYIISCATPSTTRDPTAVASISSTSVIPDRAALLIDVVLHSISRSKSSHVTLAQHFCGNPLYLDRDEAEVIAIAFAYGRSGNRNFASVGDPASGLCTRIKRFNEIRGNERDVCKLVPIVKPDSFEFFLQDLCPAQVF